MSEVFIIKLVRLNIIFQNPEDFFTEIDCALTSGRGLNTKQKNVLKIDSVKTLNNVLSVNKIHILRAISQRKPDSVYQLAMFLGREPQHVLKDCRQLEFYKFIKLVETKSERNSLRPVLSFDYDIICTNSPITPVYSISIRSESLLTG